MEPAVSLCGHSGTKKLARIHHTIRVLSSMTGRTVGLKDIAKSQLLPVLFSACVWYFIGSDENKGHGVFNRKQQCAEKMASQ